MARKNPDICPYCGTVILDEDQEYCDGCGMEIEKEDIPEKQPAFRSCLGSFCSLLILILAIILLLTER